ncbi:MAG: hypothetical protein HQL46_04690 [Gammaproteobacteria bacterium]|nr:hypothetical protein [Gammaproteobacteria bacterium]
MNDQTNLTSNKKEQLSEFIEASDAKDSQEFLQQQELELQAKLDKVSDPDSMERADILLNLANSELGQRKMEQTWNHARGAFDLYIKHKQWEKAVEASDILYQTELPSSITALGHGVWLAVTFPIPAQDSINILNHIINETPDDADGAALAAIVAHYIVDLRCEGKDKENLQFITMNMISKVAKRHSQVETQMGLSVWMDKLSLKDPAVFLPRFSLVVGAIVGEVWWFDKEELQSYIED